MTAEITFGECNLSVWYCGTTCNVRGTVYTLLYQLQWILLNNCLITRETALLVDPTNSSSSSKQWVALVVGMFQDFISRQVF